jgi:hypothetical protein
MIELRSREQIGGAIERARNEAKNLLVRLTNANRQYSVTNRMNGNSYTVDFFIRKDGRRFGHCTCKAGQNNVACKHIAAAAAMNMYMAAEGLLGRKSVSVV